ncbi:Small nuclear RNA-activating complex polypeptide 3 [Aphelenchoides besseyi]|nr:Small nuclear RNA-activating complex polypeptide 3 [Aphelenchoides besseyi]KAI6199812.1 Small nuclear RNA-activating complex polypeptide 3 [Aphelenchoides besseyi]
MSFEEVYVPKKLPYVSPPIVLSKFLSQAWQADAEFREFFGQNEKEYKVNEQNSAVENIEENARKSFTVFMEKNSMESPIEVIEEVDTSLAEIINRFPIVDYEPAYPPKNSRLSTHQVLDDIRKTSKSQKNKKDYVTRGRYFKYRESELQRPLKPKHVMPQKDIVLTVHLLRPNTILNDTIVSHNDYRTLCEVRFRIRGQMSLAKLKSKIFCQADFWCGIKHTEDASDQSNYFMNKFPSSFMFIHDTFYVDQSHPNSQDITVPVREFMQRKDCFREFYVKDLNETKVVDLKLRLGHPYLYLHQGHCEHLMIFTDLRLLHANDSQDMNSYPVRVYDRIPATACVTCKEENAAYVITESDRMPTNPAFMCQKCFKSFHFDHQTEIGEFTAYHFIDRGGLE